ncbi:PH domain-containing protein [Horticoccus sp. 23ND18S-11]|uniref:PH domain-containing protein n=1 Tax=Horticoccus sp. 23ND18S-11 TaxID=3391832 RepID=UPI0039C9C9F2
MNPPNESQEVLVWRGTPSQWTNFGTYLFCLILTAGIVAAYFLVSPATPQPLILAGLVVPFLWAMGSWIGTSCNRYEITSERAKITTGLLSRRTNEIELYRVRDYTVVEPFWLRLVGCGDVVLVTSDRTTPSFVLHAVPRAQALKDQIRAHTERMRQRRGVRDLDIDPRPSAGTPEA